MKFTTAFIVSVLTVSAYGLAVAEPPIARDTEAGAVATQACGDPRLAVPLLRAFNAALIDHFYTTNAVEMQTAITSGGYVSQGTTGYVFSDQEPHSIPLFRLYNPTTTDHLYTTNVAEKTNAIAHGYTDEGITGYVYPDPVCGGLPLYRLYSVLGTDHLYTMSPIETAFAIIRSGYTPQGIAGYIFPF